MRPAPAPSPKPWQEHVIIHIAVPDNAKREGLGALFRWQGFDLRLSKTTDELFFNLSSGLPNILIIDMDIATDGGAGILQRIRNDGETPPYIIMLSRETPALEKTVAVVKAGASSVIAGPVDSPRLLGEVHEALRPVWRPATHAPLAPDELAFPKLSARERQVLRLILDGNTNKEVGKVLKISARTVEVHRAHIMQKTGARNAVDLLRAIMDRMRPQP